VESQTTHNERGCGQVRDKNTRPQGGSIGDQHLYEQDDGCISDLHKS
jgi:hypothetical protein